MSPDQDALKTRCDAAYAGLAQAVEWVIDVRRNAPRLDRDADGLIEKLRRSRNLSRRLAAASVRPLSIGVFGMSQAGKSYLISSLARAADGQLHTVLEGHRFNFIGHINPPGGGKEATGLVTRFTRRASDAPAGYPVELTLFSEADLIKILGNSFFNDFDRERVIVISDAEDIRQHLARFEAQRQPRPTGGLDPDDVVDLMDYFERRYAKSMEPLRSDFWPTVTELAPRLAASQRGELFSLLWGGIAALTQVYVQLRNALQQLSNAQTVYAPIDALVVPRGTDYEWNPDSIINVDVLNRLGKDGATPVQVVPVTDGRVGAETPIARSLLTALTAEMKFVLADPPVAELLEHVDLLDFPGYRGRLSVASLDEVRTEIKSEDADPVAQLLLRGKVAYLFERYTDDQEMNILLMCTRCDQQIEITTLAPVLDAWVHATQGESAAARSGRPAGLVWVLTQLDRKLEPKPGQTESQQRLEWSNMIHITLLERFAQCEWLSEWGNGRAFDNVFLVRKPGFLQSVIDTPDKKSNERGFLPGQAERLATLRAMFLADERVAAHVAAAAAAWDAVLQLNDGGMERLAGYLSATAVAETKLVRIAEQIAHMVEDLTLHRLGPYYFAEEAGEVERKRAVAALVSAAIQEHADSFGELLDKLQPPSEQLRQLYLRADAASPPENGGTASPTAPAPKRASLVRLPLRSAPDAANAQPTVGRAGVFAKTVMSAWFKQLRDVPESPALQQYLGVEPTALRAVIDELIAGSDRIGVEDQLVDSLQPLEEKRSTTRIRIVDQQVFLARMIVNEFVNTLGVNAIALADRPASPTGGRRIFEPPPPIGPGSLPALANEEIPYPGMFILDWLEAFARLAVDNAGHSAGREITPEQNERLGAILGLIRGESAAATGR